MRRLGQLNVCGLVFHAFEGRAAERDTLGTAYGYCDHERQEIWIREGLSTSMFNDTLMHELLHGLLQHSGCEDFIKGVLKPEANPDEVTETLIRILTPHMRPALTAMGKLK